MNRVLEECDRVGDVFAADPVHDLRVALRRCRSMADGLMTIDSDKAWKRMKKAAQPLFQGLGELRDAQVMMEWVDRLGAAEDPVTTSLRDFIIGRESDLKKRSLSALQEFDRKQWTIWSRELPRRAARIRLGSAVFKHLALERWTEARRLHTRALRTSSQAALHQLRIGLKRFRYTVENFLPQLHAAWSDDLKELQDSLGEIHDLDVLWATALEINAFPDAESRNRWRNLIIQERKQRLEKYRQKMVGKHSLWNVWRAELPQGAQIEAAALGRLKLWASFLDPNFQHSRRVADLALQFYDGLTRQNVHLDGKRGQNLRTVLYSAALMHDVGRSRKQKNHHKVSARLIRGLSPPLGLSAEDLRLAGLVARYHRGAFPRAGHKDLAALPADQRDCVLKLAGILRLVNAFDSTGDGRISHLQLGSKDGVLYVYAQGYSPLGRIAQHVSAARYLAEVALRRPVLIKRLLAAQPKQVSPKARSAA